MLSRLASGSWPLALWQQEAEALDLADLCSHFSLFLPLQIQVGKFNYTIAMLHLGGGETAIIVSIVICSILLVLSVVGEGTGRGVSRFSDCMWRSGRGSLTC